MLLILIYAHIPAGRVTHAHRAPLSTGFRNLEMRPEEDVPTEDAVDILITNMARSFRKLFVEDLYRQSVRVRNTDATLLLREYQQALKERFPAQNCERLSPSEVLKQLLGRVPFGWSKIVQFYHRRGVSQEAVAEAVTCSLYEVARLLYKQPHMVCEFDTGSGRPLPVTTRASLRQELDDFIHFSLEQAAVRVMNNAQAQPTRHAKGPGSFGLERVIGSLRRRAAFSTCTVNVNVEDRSHTGIDDAYRVPALALDRVLASDISTPSASRHTSVAGADAKIGPWPEVKYAGPPSCQISRVVRVGRAAPNTSPIGPIGPVKSGKTAKDTRKVSVTPHRKERGAGAGLPKPRGNGANQNMKVTKLSAAGPPNVSAVPDGARTDRSDADFEAALVQDVLASDIFEQQVGDDVTGTRHDEDAAETMKRYGFEAGCENENENEFVADLMTPDVSLVLEEEDEIHDSSSRAKVICMQDADSRKSRKVKKKRREAARRASDCSFF